MRVLLAFCCLFLIASVHGSSQTDAVVNNDFFGDDDTVDNDFFGDDDFQEAVIDLGSQHDLSPMPGQNQQDSPNLDDGSSSVNQEDYSCVDLKDHGKQYTVAGVTFELRCGQGTAAEGIDVVQTPTLKTCADACASHPECRSCDWSRGNCALKNEYIGTFDYPADTWMPIEKRHIRTCPRKSNRLSQPNADPEIVKNPQCPQDNGNLFASGDGAFYTLLCCTHNPNWTSEIPNSRTIVATFSECGVKCSTKSGCQSYVYSAQANKDDAIGTCKLYSTGGFQTTACQDDTHDYAYITAPPAKDSPDFATVSCETECPLSDGQQYRSKGNEIFHIDCAKRHGTHVLHEEIQETFKDCIDACSMFVPCHSVDYHSNSKKCYYSNHHGEPEITAMGFQSAHSMGCAGVCSFHHSLNYAQKNNAA